MEFPFENRGVVLILHLHDAVSVSVVLQLLLLSQCPIGPKLRAGIRFEFSQKARKTKVPFGKMIIVVGNIQGSLLVHSYHNQCTLSDSYDLLRVLDEMYDKPVCSLS